jgi:hypothetical protein
MQLFRSNAQATIMTSVNRCNEGHIRGKEQARGAPCTNRSKKECGGSVEEG